MGKKKKRKSVKRPAGSREPSPGPIKKSKLPLLALVVGVIFVITGVYFLYQKEEKPSPPSRSLKEANTKLRETGTTLPPERFQGKVRRAYEIARQIPEVLDRLYCYCRCKENVGHKNLLSCYVDTHAST